MNIIPRQLSGGQEQRVAIARAIWSPTRRFVVADEPGRLDAKSAEDILLLLTTAQSAVSQDDRHGHARPPLGALVDTVYRLDKGVFIGSEQGGCRPNQGSRCNHLSRATRKHDKIHTPEFSRTVAQQTQNCSHRPFDCGVAVYFLQFW